MRRRINLEILNDQKVSVTVCKKIEGEIIYCKVETYFTNA
jgi:hypothetical protein